MNDQILMDNYLLLLKSTVEVYVHGTLESSNEDTRELLKECLDDTMSMQADTYDEMTEYGWYEIQNVETTQIEQTLNKLQNQDNNNNQNDNDDQESEDSENDYYQDDNEENSEEENEEE